MRNEPYIVILRFLGIVVLALVLFGAGSGRADPLPKLFNAQSYTLENGMELVVIPNHRAPVVTHMVWYHVGAADEPQGLSGTAHFLEHLMFKGSPVIGEDKPLEPGEFSEIVRRLGGNDNAFTSQDYTAYFQSIAVQHLERVMRMEAGRMRGMAPPPAHIDSERQVIREERRQRSDNDPNALFGEALSAVLYANHPYGIPVIGWAEEMERLSWKDTKAFYDTWYAPNNATLVVAGGVTGEEVYKLAAEIYGRIPAADLPPRVRTARPPPPANPPPVKYEHAAIRQPVVEKAYRVPSFRQKKKVSLALQVLEDIMGGGPTSRLYESLVREQKIASSAGMSYHSDSLDEAALWVYASPLPGVALETVEQALDAEMIKVIEQGVSEEEVRESKARLQDEAIYALDSLSGPAMVVGRALSTAASLDDVEYWPHDIAAVTRDQVESVATMYLDPVRNIPVTGYLLPKAQAPEPEPAPPPDARAAGPVPAQEEMEK